MTDSHSGMTTEYAHYPWQETIWQQLFSAHVKSDDFPHALLLAGVSGIGKKHLALHLAQGLLCQSPLENSQTGQFQPCHHCRSCQLIKAGNHPDFYYVSPPEEKKVIPVDAIRDMIQWSVLSSQLKGKKVIIIEPAEAMNQNAANSLLKTLEEPVSDTIIILITNKKQALLATIRSRCQKVDLPLPDKPKALQWLLAQQVAQPELMLSLASGAPIQAFQLANSDQLETRNSIITQLLAIHNASADPVQVAEELHRQIKALKKPPLVTPFDVIYWMDSMVMDLVRLSQNCTETTIINIDYAQNLQQLLNRLYLKKLLQLSDSFNKAYLEIQSSINVNLILENLFIDWKNCKL